MLIAVCVPVWVLLVTQCYCNNSRRRQWEAVRLVISGGGKTCDWIADLVSGEEQTGPVPHRAHLSKFQVNPSAKGTQLNLTMSEGN